MSLLSSEREQIVALYRQAGPAVYRRCLRLLGNPELARDATQEVFLKLTRHVSSLSDRSSMLPWIYRIATHHCLNMRREASRKATREHLLHVREEAMELGFEQLQLSQQLLGRFDALTQAIAVGVLVDGVEHEELAVVLGVSSKTVSRKLKRFLSNARKYVARS
jgi:RNA polymerase sigma-70 factor (ECF subfamily)